MGPRRASPVDPRPLRRPRSTGRPKRKARELAAALRRERPDYAYLKSVFRALRTELEIEVPRAPKRLPYVPSEEAIVRYYRTVWQARNVGDIVLIKTLLYTGVRVSELVHIRLDEVDLDRCQIRITAGKGDKDRVVPFPAAFKEALALHTAALRAKGATYLLKSSWKKRYSDRGVRKLLARYARAAGLAHPISPHQLRHFLLTWLKKQGIDDALIQPYSPRNSRRRRSASSGVGGGRGGTRQGRVQGLRRREGARHRNGPHSAVLWTQGLVSSVRIPAMRGHGGTALGAHPVARMGSRSTASCSNSATAYSGPGSAASSSRSPSASRR